MKSITIKFPYDLRGRAAAEFIQQVETHFPNPVYCEKEDRRINAHSLLGVLSLGIRKGEDVRFLAPEEKDINTLLEIVKV